MLRYRHRAILAVGRPIHRHFNHYSTGVFAAYSPTHIRQPLTYELSVTVSINQIERGCDTTFCKAANYKPAKRKMVAQVLFKIFGGTSSRQLESIMSDEFKRPIILDLDEVPPAAWEVPLPAPPAVKPRVQLPGRGRPIGNFATELADSLQHAGLYLHRDKVVVQKGGSAEFKPLTSKQFVTWIEDHVECHHGPVNPDGSGMIPGSLKCADAEVVIASKQFRAKLPVAKTCNRIRQPVLSGGTLRLLPTGYDEETQTLTARGTRPYALNMSLEDACNHLRTLLGEFCFRDTNQGMAVQIASMVTAYGMGLLSDNCVIPAFVYSANQAGAGKGLCVNLALIPVLDEAPPTTSVQGLNEMGKWLFASARSGEQYLFLDNVDFPLEDAWLEQYLTSSRISGRCLGTSTQEQHSKKSALYITGNRLTMRADMRRRCLVTELFLREFRAEQRVIRDPLDTNRISEEAPRILASLYAMIREWAAKGKPAPTRTHPSFMEWSKVIGGIVEHAGFACPIPCVDAEMDHDPETADMGRLVAQMNAAEARFGLTFQEVVTLCRNQDLFEGVVPAPGSERRGKTTFSRLLKRFEGREFPDGLVFRIHGTGHNRRYRVDASQAQELTIVLGSTDTAEPPPQEVPISAPDELAAA